MKISVNQITLETLTKEWKWFLSKTNGNINGKIGDQRFGQYLMNKYVGVPEVFYIEDANEVHSLVYTKLVEDETQKD
jgi:hypothetical protein